MKLTEPSQVAAALGPLMKGFGAPWCVAGGWALDLWLGRRTREHADLELVLFRDDQSLLHPHFRRWTFIARVEWAQRTVALRRDPRAPCPRNPRTLAG